MPGKTFRYVFENPGLVVGGVNILSKPIRPWDASRVEGITALVEAQLKKEYSTENLEFLLELKELYFQRKEGKKLDQKTLIDLYKKFVATDAKQQVNLKQDNFSKVEDDFKAGKLTLDSFLGAGEEIRSMMEKDSIKRFEKQSTTPKAIQDVIEQNPPSPSFFTRFKYNVIEFFQKLGEKLFGQSEPAATPIIIPPPPPLVPKIEGLASAADKLDKHKQTFDPVVPKVKSELPTSNVTRPVITPLNKAQRDQMHEAVVTEKAKQAKQLSLASPVVNPDANSSGDKPKKEGKKLK